MTIAEQMAALRSEMNELSSHVHNGMAYMLKEVPTLSDIELEGVREKLLHDAQALHDKVGLLLAHLKVTKPSGL